MHKHMHILSTLANMSKTQSLILFPSLVDQYEGPEWP